MNGEHAARLPALAYTQHQPPRKPPSPQVQQQHSPLNQQSPSTVKASPQLTPGPVDASSTAEPQTKKGMRSQIACKRCRQSKTKCENTGQGTTCKACANSNRVCSWDHAAAPSSTGSLRRDSTADDAQPKKRRKVLPTSSAVQRPAEGLGTYEDALESPLLTAQVWEELFAIYEKHISIDFPFLHKTTFLSAVQQQHQQQLPASFSDVKPPAQSQVPRPYAPLLLAFLTQTARFHDKLVHMGGDPIRTAEFYAQATRTHMGADILGMPTLEKIQALLMLGYYEWTAQQGIQGWVKIGTAIRCAIALGLPHLDVDNKGQPAKPKLNNNKSQLSEKDYFILHEISRRTFWSCCLMDSYLSWGEDRPSILRPEHYQRTQLPCSDGAFTYGRKARTRLLGEDDAKYAKRREDWDRCHNRQSESDQAHHSTQRWDAGKWEIGEYEAEITWYIKVVIAFGEVVKWSCNRGRRQEGKVAPWTVDKYGLGITGFKRLEDKYKQLKRDLPEHLQLTPDNTKDRIYNRPGPYVAIHAMYTQLCVWLYREYMPTSPWVLDEPRGPTEEPLIEETPPHPEYWINQAKECWRACSDFAHLLHSIESVRGHNSLAETPMVAFACFTVGICTTYCYYFPKMDPEDALSSRSDPKAHDIANGLLVHYTSRFIMSRQWISYQAKWQRWYRAERKKYKDHGGVPVSDSPKSSSSDGGTAGLRDYEEEFEKSHKQFGDMETLDFSNWANKDRDLADSRLPHDEDSAERTLPSVSAMVKHEKEVVSENRSDRHSLGTFTPVNVVRHVAGSPSRDARTPSNSQPPIYEAHMTNRPYPPESASQYQTHVSPTNVSYQHNPSQPQTNMQTHFSVAQPDARYANWHSTNQAERMAIEVNGLQTFDNMSTFAPMMLAGDTNQFVMPNWMMGYDNSGNTAYYPPPTGPNNPYAQ